MPHVKISTSRADVPIRVRKRIVDVEGGPDVETVAAPRAPNEEGPGSACENPCLQAYSFISFLKIQLCGGGPPLPPAATPLWAVYKQEPGRCAKASEKTDW